MADMAPHELLGRRCLGAGAAFCPCALEGCLPLPCGTASSSSAKYYNTCIINSWTIAEYLPSALTLLIWNSSADRALSATMAQHNSLIASA